MKSKFKAVYFILFFLPFYLFAQLEKNNADIPSSGTVLIESDIPEAEVYIGDEFKGRTPLTLENLKFNFQYTFTIKKNGYRTIKKNITIYKNKPKIDIYVIIGYSKILLEGNPKDITVIIDGNLTSVDLNDTLKLIPGDHIIEINKIGYYKSKNVLKLESGLFKKLEYDLQQKSKTIALPLSIVIPGAGQYYIDKNQRGLSFFGSTLFSFSLSVYFNYEMNLKKSEYAGLVEKYNQSLDEEIVNNLHDKLEDTYSNIKLYRNIRNVFLISGMGIWIYNIVDIYLWDGPNKVTSNYSFKFNIHESEFLLSLNYKF